MRRGKNRLRLAKVIVKNKMSRFLWFTVYSPFSCSSRVLDLIFPRLHGTHSLPPNQSCQGIESARTGSATGHCRAEQKADEAVPHCRPVESKTSLADWSLYTKHADTCSWRRVKPHLITFTLAPCKTTGSLSSYCWQFFAAPAVD